MSQTIEDLRRRLFETIDGVKAGTTTVEQAKTIGDLSQVIVNTAKVEVDYLRATDGGESSFISTAVGRANLPQGIGSTENKVLRSGVLSITRHTMGDD